MNKFNSVDKLVYLFSKLPGIGVRSARKIVIYLLADKDMRFKQLLDQLYNTYDQTIKCYDCGNIDCTDLCSICSDISRDNSIIAIVENIGDLWALEKSNVFRGKYHILENSKDNTTLTPKNLGLNKLLQRCQDNQVQELVIATNSTIEGQTIAFFIMEFFKRQGIHISRLASGIPVGGELDYLDEGTLLAAFESRKLFN